MLSKYSTGITVSAYIAITEALHQIQLAPIFISLPLYLGLSGNWQAIPNDSHPLAVVVCSGDNVRMIYPGIVHDQHDPSSIGTAYGREPSILYLLIPRLIYYSNGLSSVTHSHAHTEPSADTTAHPDDAFAACPESLPYSFIVGVVRGCGAVR